MAFSTSITVEQALIEVNKMSLPHIEEGDFVWYPGGTLGTDIGHRFRYEENQWVSSPAHMPT